jgi:hypothetical protein
MTPPSKIEYGFDEKGNITLDAMRPPFDGKPILILLATGWCEAWWDEGRRDEGFCWVCLDDRFEEELDSAKYWLPLPILPATTK